MLHYCSTGLHKVREGRLNHLSRIGSIERLDFCMWIEQPNVVLTRPDLCLCPVSQLEGVRRYGPMWKASFGPILTVHVADPVLIEQVLRKEGQHPMRSDLSSWKDYRRLRGHHYGLLTS